MPAGPGPRRLPDAPGPALVAAARSAADRPGFGHSCVPEVGRLLATLAAVRPSGLVGESGTGHGVGSAWLLSGLGPGGRLVTVEHDPARAVSAASVLTDPRALVLTGDWRLLAAHAPFDLLFCDGGGKRDDPDGVVGLLAPGGILVLDDFTPAYGGPPVHDGAPDELRLRYLDHPALVTTEVVLTRTQACLLATRR